MQQGVQESRSVPPRTSCATCCLHMAPPLTGTGAAHLFVPLHTRTCCTAPVPPPGSCLTPTWRRRRRRCSPQPAPFRSALRCCTAVAAAAVDGDGVSSEPSTPAGTITGHLVRLRGCSTHMHAAGMTAASGVYNSSGTGIGTSASPLHSLQAVLLLSSALLSSACPTSTLCKSNKKQMHVISPGLT